jgi:hypothetical protein
MSGKKVTGGQTKGKEKNKKGRPRRRWMDDVE